MYGVKKYSLPSTLKFNYIMTLSLSCLLSADNSTKFFCSLWRENVVFSKMSTKMIKGFLSINNNRWRELTMWIYTEDSFKFYLFFSFWNFFFYIASSTSTYMLYFIHDNFVSSLCFYLSAYHRYQLPRPDSL